MLTIKGLIGNDKEVRRRCEEPQMTDQYSIIKATSITHDALDPEDT